MYTYLQTSSLLGTVIAIFYRNLEGMCCVPGDDLMDGTGGIVNQSDVIMESDAANRKSCCTKS